ncbi:MAG: hypothetical protein LH472_10540 [Pyrinomonadaceae bacterium]|nr:hypothetical protein [Pyrinomonadaceae bacterium]
MRKKFLAMFSIVFVMAFAVAVYAFNQTNSSNKTTASCCAKSDNCPLKDKNAQTAGLKTDGSCCDKADCCCKSGACPMKANGAKTSENGDCCDNCCGGSCPMKEKQTTAAVKAENESCPHLTAGV